MIVSEVEYQEKLVFDKAKPGRTPRKILDVSKMNNLS
jgi:hypothetical protein